MKNKKIIFRIKSENIWKFISNIIKDQDIDCEITYEHIHRVLSLEKHKEIYFEIYNKIVTGYYFPQNFRKEEYVIIKTPQEFIKLLNDERN